MLGILEKISPSELVYNGYISNHNKVRRPRPKFKVSFYLYFCCIWINVTQINLENIKRKIQRIISDSCFQLKLWFNFDARAPSIPLLNFPFKQNKECMDGLQGESFSTISSRKVKQHFKITVLYMWLFSWWFYFRESVLTKMSTSIQLWLFIVMKTSQKFWN